MKKYISYIMMAMLSVWMLSSCNQEVIQSTGLGYLDVSLGSDLSEDVVTKADEDLSFTVDILNASGVSVAQRVISTTTDGRPTVSEPIELQVGNYSVEAVCGENLNAAFENPYYAGRSATVKVNPNRTATASLTCTLANTIFSVEFPGDFSHFTDYEVSVTNGIGNKLVFSNKPQAGNELEADFGAKAYFAVTGKLTWELYLKNTDGGEFRATETYTDVKAKQHYHLTFAMGEEDGNDGAFIINVQLQNSWDDTDHDLILDFSKKNLPEVSVNEAFSAVSGEPVSVPVGNAAEKTFAFTAEEGVKSLRVAHDNAVLAEAGLPKVVELAGASQELMSSLNAAGFVVTDVPTKAVDANSKNVTINITGLIAKLPVGSYNIDFTLVDTKGRYQQFSLVLEIISDVDAEAVAARTGWAAFAQLEGRFYDITKKDVLTFQYKKVSDSEWIELPNKDMVFNTVSLRYSTVLTGLQPSAEYVFRAVSDEDKDTRQIRFTTAGAGTIHNLSFDSWYLDGKAWMPNASGYSVWDTANPGTSGLGYVPTTPEESTVVKGKAARLETQLANVMGIKKLAAGNIYTGNFVKVAGVGAELKWGVPFTTRPLALRGYWKYAPKTIDRAEKPYTDMKGQTDFGQVQIFLTDWSEQFLISTSNKQFVDFNSSAIIARGEIHTNETHGGYVKFTIPLVYRDNRIPKYAVISAAASMYGDYFTGGVGSVLLLDEFELVYDPAELTDAEYKAVFSQISPF